MDASVPASALRIATLPLRAVGGVLSLARELASLPAKLAEIAEAIAVLPEIERQLARIEAAIAHAAPISNELRGSLADMPDTVRQLDAAVAQLVGLIDELAGSLARTNGAAAPVEPDLEPIQTSAERVGQLAGRLRLRRRRFARTT
jgi:ABC-type transporter Mla subunit MlaD